LRLIEITDVGACEVASLILEMIHWNLDLEALNLFNLARYLIIDGLVLHQPCQDVEKQLVVVSLLGKVGLELLLKLASDRDLLGLEETLQQHVDSHIDVIRAYIVAQMHSSVSFRHSEHRLNMSH
jgi:hypothetical protein